MERTTGKHSPAVDDQLEHEQQAMTHGAPDEGRTEARRTEGPVPDEPGAGIRPEAEVPAGADPGWSEQQHRAELASTFPPSRFPAQTADLVALARDAFADDDLVDALAALPDRTYGNVSQVAADLAERSDHGG
jgi:Protein of unknown function (DUF2795)